MPCRRLRRFGCAADRQLMARPVCDRPAIIPMHMIAQRSAR
jgi:hypothetical protein